MESTAEETPDANEMLKIVIVDDHGLVGESIARMFEMEPDFEVVGLAKNVCDGIELARKSKPDIAVVDFRLPDGNGAQATEAIARVSPDTKVIMLTGNADEKVFSAAVEAGCKGFVGKDEASRVLIDVVRTVSTGGVHFPSEMMVNLIPRLKKGYRGIGSDITDREKEILTFLASGRSNQSISTDLFLSVHTVRNHVQSILAKLQAHSQLEAVAIALREGIIEQV
ncbi:MAG TPA: response regulator transcription factor [Acidimicrobiales bacterium]|nr:response regulator transcription factor [Acidimicrobiales bacterium]